MKVYLNIVVNHTGDIIKYRECPNALYSYWGKDEYPYTRRSGVGSMPINYNFQGDVAAAQTTPNFKLLTDPRYAYTPYAPQGQKHIKKPAWLSEVTLYHNRDELTFRGESSQDVEVAAGTHGSNGEAA